MKVMKRTGLAVVEFKQDTGPYRAGDRVRLNPDDAAKYQGFFAETKPRDGEEMVNAPQAESVLISGRILPAEVPAIPDDWGNRHELERTKLAEQIVGRPVKRGEAEKIIRAELERRLTE